MYQVKDVMTDDLAVIGPQATIDEATSLMLARQVSGLPVLDEEGVLLGLITELDIIDLVYDADIDNTVVVDYMTGDVCALDVDASLDDAASIFCNRSIRRIPIVQDGRLVGVVSRRDLIRFIQQVRRQPALV